MMPFMKDLITMACPDCSMLMLNLHNEVMRVFDPGHCERCGGTGTVESTESLLKQILTALQPVVGCKHCLEERGVDTSHCKAHRYADHDE